MGSAPVALWGKRVQWPHLLLRSVREPAQGAGVMLPASTQHHVILLAEGTGKVAFRSRGEPGWQSIQLTEGDVLLRRAGAPQQELQWEAPAPSHLVHAHLSASLFERLDPEGRAFENAPTPGVLLRVRDPLVEQLLRSLDRAARAPSDADERYAQLAAELLALHLVRDVLALSPAAGIGGLPPLVLRRVCAHVEAHLEEPLRLESLARVAGLSPAYFARAFKASTGQTPHGYVRSRRVAAVERLLRDTERPLAEIALATGFATQARMTTVFRTVARLPPGEYRRAHRG